MSSNTVKLKTAEAARVASFLARVVPLSAEEQAELYAYIVRLNGGRG